MVDRAAGISSQVFRVAISNNELWVAPPKDLKDGIGMGVPHSLLGMITKVLCQHPLPDMELAITTSDLDRASRDKPAAPLFSWSKTASQWDVLYPYWKDLMNDGSNLTGLVPWANKQDKAFWRGATTGDAGGGGGRALAAAGAAARPSRQPLLSWTRS